MWYIYQELMLNITWTAILCAWLLLSIRLLVTAVYIIHIIWKIGSSTGTKPKETPADETIIILGVWKHKIIFLVFG